MTGEKLKELSDRARSFQQLLRQLRPRRLNQAIEDVLNDVVEEIEQLTSDVLEDKEDSIREKIVEGFQRLVRDDCQEALNYVSSLKRITSVDPSIGREKDSVGADLVILLNVFAEWCQEKKAETYSDDEFFGTPFNVFSDNLDAFYLLVNQYLIVMLVTANEDSIFDLIQDTLNVKSPTIMILEEKTLQALKKKNAEGLEKYKLDQLTYELARERNLTGRKMTALANITKILYDDHMVNILASSEHLLSRTRKMIKLSFRGASDEVVEECTNDTMKHFQLLRCCMKTVRHLGEDIEEVVDAKETGVYRDAIIMGMIVEHEVANIADRCGRTIWNHKEKYYRMLKKDLIQLTAIPCNEFCMTLAIRGLKPDDPICQEAWEATKSVIEACLTNLELIQEAIQERKCVIHVEKAIKSLCAKVYAVRELLSALSDKLISGDDSQRRSPESVADDMIPPMPRYFKDMFTQIEIGQRLPYDHSEVDMASRAVVEIVDWSDFYAK